MFVRYEYTFRPPVNLSSITGPTSASLRRLFDVHPLLYIYTPAAVSFRNLLSSVWTFR